MNKKYYVIANNDNTKFIARDEASGGYPYVTDYFPFSLISGYDYINEYYKGLEPYVKDASDFSIKEICLK